MNRELGHRWILLRGLARESAHWGEFTPLLQSAFPDAQVTMLDLPGTGRFYQDKSPETLEAITNRVRDNAASQGLLQKPVTVLALSLGAMVAWEWMLRCPKDICGAVLINPSFSGLSPFYQRLRWQSYRQFAGLMMKRKLKDRESAILQLTSNLRAEDQRLIQDWAAIQRLRPVSGRNLVRQMLAAGNYEPGASKPLQPVLLLNSLGDQLVAPACSEAIARQWNLELCTHPWAGHDLTLDDDTWVIRQLKDWMKQNSALSLSP